MVTLFTGFDAKDAVAAATPEAMLSELGATVPFEPGSLDYEAYGTEEEPTTLYVKERRSSRGDADRHVQSVVESGGMARTKELLAAPLATVTLLGI